MKICIISTKLTFRLNAFYFKKLIENLGQNIEFTLITIYYLHNVYLAKDMYYELAEALLVYLLGIFCSCFGYCISPPYQDGTRKVISIS